MAARRKKKNPLQPLLELVPIPFRNKFALVAVLFFIWMAFFDKHNLLTQLSLQNTIDKMERDENFYTQRIQEAKQDRIDLIRNAEKFARERYYMSKPNEDVFVIEK